MATEAQILANRANATRSTGPRTESWLPAASPACVKNCLSSLDRKIASPDERCQPEPRPSGSGGRSRSIHKALPYTR